MARCAPIPGLAAKLQAAREAAGLTQHVAADRSGVHHVSIARFEKGQRVPTIATLYKLALAYGVVVGELLPPQSLSTDSAHPGATDGDSP
jgi:transcriptional regulator with XRE-family HTH domain